MSLNTQDCHRMNCDRIEFDFDKSRVSPDKVQRLFNLSAFWAKDRSLEDWQTAISFSEPVLAAWDGTRLIGFARASSDGVYRASIWDVVIHPEYRGAGLGRQLLERLLAHERMARVERVYLSTTFKAGFYERLGFQKNQSTTMVLMKDLVLPKALESEEVEYTNSSELDFH
ncbi:MAG: GNAT family N-acetyltransferase [Cyanobacteria bacterium P01_H01_bin.15]